MALPPVLTNEQLAVQLQARVTLGRCLSDLLWQPVHLQAGLLDVPLRGDPVPLVIVERRGRPHHNLHGPVPNVK